MTTHVNLKNAEGYLILDQKVYDDLQNDAYLHQFNFFQNIRLHSSGCSVFQKTIKRTSPEAGYRTVTIYPHKLIAERYLLEQRTEEANLVGTHNGNKLDCRLSNLVYRTRSTVSRKRKSISKTGYTGVYQENTRYRAVISHHRKSVHIGMYATAEEAALAYNRKSLELFGQRGKVNIVPSPDKTDVNDTMIASSH